MHKRFILLCWSWICLQLLYVILLFSCFGHNNEIEWLFVIKYQLIGILLYRKNPLICKKLNCINMKKIFILLFVSLALFSCEKKKIIKFLNISCCQVRTYLNHLVVWGETYYYFYNYSKNIDRWYFRFRGSDYSQGCFDRIW